MVLALRQRVSAAALPGEFYDTLGAIQESVGQTAMPRQSYVDGLKKAPKHPGPQLPSRQVDRQRPQPSRQGHGRT